MNWQDKGLNAGSAAEVGDAYDKDFNLIKGATLMRGEHRGEGLYYMVGEVLLRHIDGTYLLMQRHPDKLYGLYWEASAGGASQQGETPYECAGRELNEETGIFCENLTYMGRVRSDEWNTWFVVYFAETDCPKDAVRLLEGETVAYRWVTEEELLALTTNEVMGGRSIEFLRSQRDGVNANKGVPCQADLTVAQGEPEALT